LGLDFILKVHGLVTSSSVGLPIAYTEHYCVAAPNGNQT